MKNFQQLLQSYPQLLSKKKYPGIFGRVAGITEWRFSRFWAKKIFKKPSKLALEAAFRFAVLFPILLKCLPLLHLPTIEKNMFFLTRVEKLLQSCF